MQVNKNFVSKVHFYKQKQFDVFAAFFPTLGDHAVTFSKKKHIYICIPNECMKLIYHTHCAKRSGCLTTCKGQQVLFFSSVFTEELSSNAEIAELFL